MWVVLHHELYPKCVGEGLPGHLAVSAELLEKLLCVRVCGHAEHTVVDEERRRHGLGGVEEETWFGRHGFETHVPQPGRDGVVLEEGSLGDSGYSFHHLAVEWGKVEWAKLVGVRVESWREHQHDPSDVHRVAVESVALVELVGE